MTVTDCATIFCYHYSTAYQSSQKSLGAEIVPNERK